jgi:hypothetical protein
MWYIVGWPQRPTTTIVRCFSFILFFCITTHWAHLFANCFVSFFFDSHQHQAAQSVKFLAKPSTQMLEILRMRFEPFLIDEIENKASKSWTTTITTTRAIVFLPPQNHLLVLFQVEQNMTLVHIRTDYWRILSYIDTFFDEL